MRYTILYIFLLAFGASQAQTAVFKARFKSLQNGEPVLYAKIINGSGDFRLTNIDGYVRIEYNPGDELKVSHLVFDTLTIKTSDWAGRDSLVFYLTPKVYTLREVTFSILGERSLFDNKFVNNDLGKSDAEKVSEKLNINEMKKELKSLDQAAQGGMVLGSPISFLYDRYSKGGKERRKYAMLLEADRRRAISRKQFDNLTITTLTNFTEEELVKFKAFCAFHPTYLEAVDALTLYFEILRCKEEFIQKEI